MISSAIIFSAPDFEPVFRWPASPPRTTPAPPRKLPPAHHARSRSRKGKPESPHANCSIEYLEQLKRDNYTTDGGREFIAEEVDALLVQKYQRRADQAIREKISAIPNF